MKKYGVCGGVMLILLVSIPFFHSVIRQPIFAAAIESRKDPFIQRPVKKVEYALPYPGILSDNPLFFLKNLRDRIIELLISDPMNKIEFYILQADKKLNMGITLSGMGKSSEVQDVLNESFAARAKAVAVFESAVQSGRSVPTFITEKLSMSLQKHREVLTDLKLSTDSIAVLLASFQKAVQ